MLVQKDLRRYLGRNLYLNPEQKLESSITGLPFSAQDSPRVLSPTTLGPVDGVNSALGGCSGQGRLLSSSQPDLCPLDGSIPPSPPAVTVTNASRSTSFSRIGVEYPLLA